MFRTQNDLELRVSQLLKSYISWAQPAGDGPLQTTRGGMTVMDLKNHRTHVVSYLKTATDIRDSPDFGSLSQDHQDDVTDLIAHLTAADEELDAATDHDAVWANLSHQQKHNVMHLVHVDDDTAKQLNARVQLKKMKPEETPATDAPAKPKK